MKFCAKVDMWTVYDNNDNGQRKQALLCQLRWGKNEKSERR